jgi:hypothetical protein
MFHFAEGHAHYRKAGLLLLLLQLSLYVFGLPPFAAGIWLQTEPDMVALFTCASAGAVWLLVGVVRGCLIRQPAHLAWHCLLLWGGWQIVASLFAPSLWRSWFGPVEMGEGAGWHMALLLAVMVATPLWQVEHYRRLLVIIAACHIAVQAALHFIFTSHDVAAVYEPGTWAPAQWGDYLAFLAGYLWIMVMAARPKNDTAMVSTLAAFCLAVLYISHNTTGIVMVSAAILASAAVHLLEAHSRLPAILRAGTGWRRLALLGCLLPMAWVFFSMSYTESAHYEARDETGFLSLSSKDGPLGSRIGLIQVAEAGLRHEPHRWLAGNGWGEFTDSMFKYALVDGVYVFHEGKRQPNWAFVDGRAYHTHCQPLEALLALGLPGMMLWFALPMLVLMALPAALFWSCAPMVVALVGVAYFWFQLPQCVPYQALALAALFSQCPPQARLREGVKPLWLKAGLGVAALLMAGSALLQLDALRYGERLHEVAEGRTEPVLPVEWLARDNMRGGDRLRGSAMGYALILGQTGTVSEAQRDWYGRYLLAAKEAAHSPHSGARLIHLELWLQYKLLLDLGFPVFAELGHQAVMDLPETVLRVAKAAPLRDDVATNMLLNLSEMTRGDVARQTSILKGLLAAAPDHRGALWVLGHLLRQSPGAEPEGEAMLRRAVALGVERVFPVTEAELAPFR